MVTCLRWHHREVFDKKCVLGGHVLITRKPPLVADLSLIHGSSLPCFRGFCVCSSSWCLPSGNGLVTCRHKLPISFRRLRVYDVPPSDADRPVRHSTTKRRHHSEKIKGCRQPSCFWCSTETRSVTKAVFGFSLCYHIRCLAILNTSPFVFRSSFSMRSSVLIRQCNGPQISNTRLQTLDEQNPKGVSPFISPLYLWEMTLLFSYGRQWPQNSKVLFINSRIFFLFIFPYLFVDC